MNKHEDDDETYSLTMWGCLQVTLADYGIAADVPAKVGNHIVDDFFELLMENGYVEKKSDESNPD